MPCVCSVLIDHRWRQNVVRHKSGSRSRCSQSDTDERLTTIWRPLLSITEQIHGNKECICFIFLKKIKCFYVIYASVLQQIISKNQLKLMYNSGLSSTLFKLHTTLWAPFAFFSDEWSHWRKLSPYQGGVHICLYWLPSKGTSEY